MISVGIDVSKEKSTVCVLKPYGEIVMKPKDVQHVIRQIKCGLIPQIKNNFLRYAEAL